MAYQGIYGEWYDDNGNPSQDPSQSQGSAPIAPGAAMSDADYQAWLTANGYQAGQSYAGTNPDGTPKQVANLPGNDAAHPANAGSWQRNQSSGDPYWLPQTDPGHADNKVGPGWAPSGNDWAYTAPPPPGGPTGGGQLNSPATTAGFFPNYSFTPYNGFTPFSYDSYTPLSGDQAAAEPGYDFAKQQGRDAVQTSQAAHGNVLSGAALKDLFAWGDQFAGQNYQNAEARNENVYGLNRSNAYNNWAANETGKYQQWQGNLQPAQFAASLGTNQGALTLADLLGRFNTTTNSLTNIATAGAR